MSDVPATSLKLGRWHHALPDGRLQCDLCPRHCRLHDGQRGFCFVRDRRGSDIVLTSYGLAAGLCVDPIEKKPLHHFHPGSSVLSLGTAGCNLGCKFCQNWRTSKARTQDVLTTPAPPERVAELASELGCQSVAFTYNDPVIFAEYAIDTAQACLARGLLPAVVTAGYVSAQARPSLFAPMRAANVDLKGFTSRFYERLCAGQLEPVLDTLRYLRQETDIWLELTTLLIPGQNDDPNELQRLCDWVVEHLGPDTPLHFTAFHPDFRLTSLPRTPASSCLRARQRALGAGLRHVYIGNLGSPDGQATRCANCQQLLVARDGYRITSYALDGDRCSSCGARCPGRFSRE